MRNQTEASTQSRTDSITMCVPGETEIEMRRLNRFPIGSMEKPIFNQKKRDLL